MFQKLLLSSTSARHMKGLRQTPQHKSGVLSAIPFHQYSNSSQEVVVDLDSKTGIAVMKWNHRPVNSLGYEFMLKSTETLQSLDENPNCKAVILTSAIPNIFCAGLDFKEIINPTRERAKQYTRTTNTLWATIYGMKIPTIAAINGSAPAGGCLIALSFDYRIMTKKGIIGLSEVKLGIPVRKWIIEAFKNVVGHRQAELAITRGQLFEPHEALAIGLVDELASNDEELLEKAKREAEVLLGVSSTARHESKLVLRQPLLDEIKNKLEESAEIFADSVTSADLQSHLAAHIERLKRKEPTVKP